MSRMKQRFECDIAEHQMTVLLDEGLHRRLRCQKPGTWIYGFDIITWPGYLVMAGDAGNYMFSRIEDMFDFFTGEQINPAYWAEKLRGCPEPYVFSAEVYRARVREWAAEISQGMETRESAVFLDAVQADLLRRELYDAHEAHRLLDEFEHDAIRWDSWDRGSFQEFDGRFLWACHAIRWAIIQYKTRTTVLKSVEG